MIDTQTKTNKKAKSDPCHCAEPLPGGACCELICFERPNYFCGHLLTDDDLSTEQRYAIEKRKLHNRTLHGWGVVCGLRMTCDDECGGVMIDEGYALDDCGNDLVVCQPLRFDVIGKLREKGYLVGDAAYDPCKPKDEQDYCQIKQCFYITICYDEEPQDFTTPFVAGCRPSLTECEPTRIREGVQFDVLNELPKKTTWLEELECRIKHCARLFTEGQFAKTLNDNIDDINIAVTEGAQPHDKWWELFCTLRGLLLLYLSKCPDKYNCTLDYEIRKIPFPQDPSYETGSTLPNYDQGQGQGKYKEGRTYLRENYAGDISAAFCRLLELAYQHVVSCILGELIFPCKEPCGPSCVVLGTIEVVGDKVVHVCNCPRSYVWSFASFWEVIVATVLGGLACEETAQNERYTDPRQTGTLNMGDKAQWKDAQSPGAQHPGATTGGPSTNRFPNDDKYEEELKRICCGVAKFDCQEFVKRLQANQRTIFDGSTAALEMFSDLWRSLRYAFDFTRPETVSAKTFIGLDLTQARQRATNLKAKLRIADQPLEQQLLEPLQAFRSNLLGGPERSIYVYESGGRIVDARAEWREEALIQKADWAQINKLQDQVGKLQDRLTKAEEMVETLSRFRRQVNEGIAEGGPGTKKRSTRKRGLGPQEGGENG